MNTAAAFRRLAGHPDTDGQLLARFASARDEAAFTELVRRHGPMVRAACRRALGNTPDADDAFQAAFLVLARRVATVGDARGLGNWLYGVARRTSLRLRDAERRRRRHESRAGMSQPADPPDPGVAAAVDEELARLPARYRTALVTCLLEGRTQEAVARDSGRSLSTVRRDLDRGRKMLRGRLTRRGSRRR